MTGHDSPGAATGQGSPRAAIEQGLSRYVKQFLSARCTLLYKVYMPSLRRALATAELLLILPSALFITALFVRNLQPIRYEPAATAQRIVDWYAARPHIALWGFLMALPLTVLVMGGAALVRLWNNDAALRDTTREVLAAAKAHLATLLIAAATLTAAVVLAIVALHVLTD